jgi:hypothetical protein
MADPRRPVLIAGSCLLGLSAASFAASMVLAAAAHPALREAARALRAASPWMLLAGALLVLVWGVVNRAARTPGSRKESTLFSESTRLDEPTEDGPRR